MSENRLPNYLDQIQQAVIMNFIIRQIAMAERMTHEVKETLREANDPNAKSYSHPSDAGTH